MIEHFEDYHFYTNPSQPPTMVRHITDERILELYNLMIRMREKEPHYWIVHNITQLKRELLNRMHHNPL